jgi:site-specific DNA-methyltransferase (adenine-specific)
MAEKAYTDGRLLVGNCLETLKTLEDNSIDSIVTDPPYELGFMGKTWDNSGVAYQVSLWQECLRVLKPGGHLLAFGGTRTYHRMAVAIEDAGFEIRDSIHWTYGSGFPKSLDISKAIDKAAKAERKVVGQNQYASRKPQKKINHNQKWGNTLGAESTTYITEPTTEQAKQWQGWGTALKPSHEPIVLARKPLIGTVAENVLQHSTGGINIDGTRIGYTNETDSRVGTDFVSNGGDASNNSNDNQVPNKHYVQMYKATGRFPANTLLTHNHDCQATGTVTDDITLNGEGNDKLFHGNFNGGQDQTQKSATTTTYTCTPNCPVATLNQQSGITKSSARVGHPGGSTFGGSEMGENVIGTWFGDTGGASRFFHNSQWTPADDITPFIYQAKAGKKERNAGLEGLDARKSGKMMRTANNTSDQQSEGFERFGTEPSQNFHPTVKPVQLMRYLIKMITPPNGIVLDPFLGSGTTAVAAVLEGFDWKGCEMTEDYLPIIKGRVNWALKEKKKEQPKLI